ncbi:MAG: alpha/beta hydrolase, partial [Pseudomonadota bacterium]
MKRCLRLGFAVALAWGLAVCAAPGQDQKTFAAPADVDLQRDVEYGKGGGRPLKMHILKPKAPPKGLMPVVVWVHGGGWRGGNKDSGLRLLAPFAQRGYFCASIEYRLSGEAPFPAQIQDCKCAIRFLRARATEFKIDPDRIGVWGGSAGGHLVALLGTSAGIKELEGTGGWQDQPSHVQAVCDWYGPSDLLKISAGRPAKENAPSAVALLLGGPAQERKDLAALASPLTHVGKKAPPFLIVHGDKDATVPLNQSVILRDALKKAGVE